MPISVACEHFPLTEPVKEHLFDQLRTVEESITGRTEITSAFLSKVTDREYQVVLKARAPGREIVARARGENIFSAIASSSDQLKRRIL